MVSRIFMYKLYLMIGIPMLIIGMSLFAAMNIKFIRTRLTNRNRMVKSKSMQSLTEELTPIRELSEMHRRNSAEMEGFKVKLVAEISDVNLYEREISKLGADKAVGRKRDSYTYYPARNSDDFERLKFNKVIMRKRNRILKYKSLIKNYEIEQNNILNYVKLHQDRLTAVLRHQNIAKNQKRADSLKIDLDKNDTERRVLYGKYDATFENHKEYNARLKILETEMTFLKFQDQNEYNILFNEKIHLNQKVRVGNERMSTLIDDIMVKTRMRGSILEELYKL